MTEDELGDLRRTHYSNQLDSSQEGNEVTIMGWVSSVRSHGNISFLTISDKNGDIQIVAKAGSCPDNILEKISKLKSHSSISITGKVQSSPKAPGGVEIMPSAMKIFSEVQKIPPFEPPSVAVAIILGVLISTKSSS